MHAFAYWPPNDEHLYYIYHAHARRHCSYYALRLHKKTFQKNLFPAYISQLYLTWEKRVRMFLFQWGCCSMNISNLHANDVRMSLPKYLIHIPSCEISSWLLPMLHTIQSETSKQNHRNFTALKPPTNQDKQHGITQNARNSSVSAS